MPTARVIKDFIDIKEGVRRSAGERMSADAERIAELSAKGLVEVPKKKEDDRYYSRTTRGRRG